jgi:hypothetical protein
MLAALERDPAMDATRDESVPADEATGQAFFRLAGAWVERLLLQAFPELTPPHMTGGNVTGQNVITANEGDGISVCPEQSNNNCSSDTVGNTFRSNSIYENDGDGIDLNAGANHNIPRPTILAAFAGPPSTVRVRASCPPLGEGFRECIVEIFNNGPGEVEDYEGRTPLGTGRIQSPGPCIECSSNVTETFIILVNPPQVGDELTATVTRLDTGDTSEFSYPREVHPGVDD